MQVAPLAPMGSHPPADDPTFLAMDMDMDMDMDVPLDIDPLASLAYHEGQASASASGSGVQMLWQPPEPSLAALPVDASKTEPKPAYYKLQFGDEQTGFSYYVRTLAVVIGRKVEKSAVDDPKATPQPVPADQSEPIPKPLSIDLQLGDINMEDLPDMLSVLEHVPDTSLSDTFLPPPPPPQTRSDADHVDVDLGPLKSVSRNHARIEYRADLGHFCLEILGRNGAWVDDRYYVKGSVVPLKQGSIIQIATRIFSFILPPAADGSPYPSPYAEADPTSPLEDVPWPYNLPADQVTYTEFFDAQPPAQQPQPFNAFAAADGHGLGLGMTDTGNRFWDEEWESSERDSWGSRSEGDSDDGDDDDGSESELSDLSSISEQEEYSSGSKGETRKGETRASTLDPNSHDLSHPVPTSHRRSSHTGGKGKGAKKRKSILNPDSDLSSLSSLSEDEESADEWDEEQIAHQSSSGDEDYEPGPTISLKPPIIRISTPKITLTPAHSRSESVTSTVKAEPASPHVPTHMGKGPMTINKAGKLPAKSMKAFKAAKAAKGMKRSGKKDKAEEIVVNDDKDVEMEEESAPTAVINPPSAPVESIKIESVPIAASDISSETPTAPVASATTPTPIPTLTPEEKEALKLKEQEAAAARARELEEKQKAKAREKEIKLKEKEARQKEKEARQREKEARQREKEAKAKEREEAKAKKEREKEAAAREKEIKEKERLAEKEKEKDKDKDKDKAPLTLATLVAADGAGPAATGSVPTLATVDGSVAAGPALVPAVDDSAATAAKTTQPPTLATASSENTTQPATAKPVKPKQPKPAKPKAPKPKAETPKPGEGTSATPSSAQQPATLSQVQTLAQMQVKPEPGPATLASLAPDKPASSANPSLTPPVRPGLPTPALPPPGSFQSKSPVATLASLTPTPSATTGAATLAAATAASVPPPRPPGPAVRPPAAGPATPAGAGAVRPTVRPPTSTTPVRPPGPPIRPPGALINGGTFRPPPRPVGPIIPMPGQVGFIGPLVRPPGPIPKPPPPPKEPTVPMINGLPVYGPHALPPKKQRKKALPKKEGEEEKDKDKEKPKKKVVKKKKEELDPVAAAAAAAAAMAASGVVPRGSNTVIPHAEAAAALAAGLPIGTLTAKVGTEGAVSTVDNKKVIPTGPAVRPPSSTGPVMIEPTRPPGFIGPLNRPMPAMPRPVRPPTGPAVRPGMVRPAPTGPPARPPRPPPPAGINGVRPPARPLLSGQGVPGAPTGPAAMTVRPATPTGPKVASPARPPAGPKAVSGPTSTAPAGTGPGAGQAASGVSAPANPPAGSGAPTSAQATPIDVKPIITEDKPTSKAGTPEIGTPNRRPTLPTAASSPGGTPEPPRPFYLTELIETPGRPGHIVVNVPIPPSGAGPRPPPGPLIGLDGQAFIGPGPIKPTATFATIIFTALAHLPRGRGTLGEVCNWIAGEWEWFRLNVDSGWQNSIRHNLSLSKAFLKVPRIPEDDPESKGSVWVIDPTEGPLFEEKQKKEMGAKAEIKAGKAEVKAVKSKEEKPKVAMPGPGGMSVPGAPGQGPGQFSVQGQSNSLQSRPPVPTSATAQQNARPPIRPPIRPPQVRAPSVRPPVRPPVRPINGTANSKPPEPIVRRPPEPFDIVMKAITPEMRKSSTLPPPPDGSEAVFTCDGKTMYLDPVSFGHMNAALISKLSQLGVDMAATVLQNFINDKHAKAKAAEAEAKAANGVGGAVGNGGPSGTSAGIGSGKVGAMRGVRPAVMGSGVVRPRAPKGQPKAIVGPPGAQARPARPAMPSVRPPARPPIQHSHSPSPAPPASTAASGSGHSPCPPSNSASSSAPPAATSSVSASNPPPSNAQFDSKYIIGVISKLAAVASERKDVSAVGKYAPELLAYLKYKGTDVSIRVADGIWRTGVLPVDVRNWATRTGAVGQKGGARGPGVGSGSPGVGPGQGQAKNVASTGGTAGTSAQQGKAGATLAPVPASGSASAAIATSPASVPLPVPTQTGPVKPSANNPTGSATSPALSAAPPISHPPVAAAGLTGLQTASQPPPGPVTASDTSSTAATNANPGPTSATATSAVPATASTASVAPAASAPTSPAAPALVAAPTTLPAVQGSAQPANNKRKVDDDEGTPDENGETKKQKVDG